MTFVIHFGGDVIGKASPFYVKKHTAKFRKGRCVLCVQLNSFDY